ncbi:MULTISPECIES: tRNA (5-methylaminomethyl-2-thiouridine)(34)-methyltransferase MnmD [unclassified Moraxella]|uniref:tRNA (5-methylaminomethyl-2-thiouridine)(34)-methyltransferase MnmD n=1 Tax=unclassified Moraxella TaxID=2685852 RepID=UPI003AF9F3E5
MTNIQPAQIQWQTDDNGSTIPTSTQFGDVYFSKTDGLAETRYVFLDGNDLAHRLAHLPDFERFVIGEIGFGTGLNVLAIWQMWQQAKPNNHSHLHIITTEKFPLSKDDLQQALSVWHELAPFAKQLIANYPPPLAGCHRLNFFDERITIDIWLGDATDSLSQVLGQSKVNAWLLDGFAPSCNDELWSNGLFEQIARLSDNGTTLATFSVASMVKNGLKNHGFTLAKRKGFGKKREMLTASFTPVEKRIEFSQFNFRYNKKIKPYFITLPFTERFESKLRTRKKPSKRKGFALPNFSPTTQALNIAVIGAGVAGLSVAYALAVRGHSVTIFDKDKPLSGASGNIRGFLAPKLTSLKRLATNLHAIGYLASCRFYPFLTQQTGFDILDTTTCLDLLSHNRLELNEVQDFPCEFASLLSAEQADNLAGYEVGQAILLPNAGLINTANFAKAVLSHPNIRFQQGNLTAFTQVHDSVELRISNIVTETEKWDKAGERNCTTSTVSEPNAVPISAFEDYTQKFDHAVLCIALNTCDFLPQIKRFNYSRGQVSWFTVDKQQAENLPKLPLKYGSYFASFANNGNKVVMLGASFVRDTLDTEPKLADHISNVTEFLDAVPQAKEIINMDNINTHWQGRASIRSQTVDYLPLVGQVWHGSFYNKGFETDSRVWTFSALGSKGYAYAPVCSELVAGLMCGEILPLANNMVGKLSPNRRVLQQT